jgi:hypothetical protein
MNVVLGPLSVVVVSAGPACDRSAQEISEHQAS